MLKLLVLLQLAAIQYDDLRTTRVTGRHRSKSRERGSVTIEHVLWAVAVIAIVGVVVAAVTSYVKSQAGNIK
jgi:heme/copper-type cytochrome/quinol oxidase subunit 2